MKKLLFLLLFLPLLSYCQIDHKKSITVDWWSDNEDLAPAYVYSSEYQAVLTWAATNNATPPLADIDKEAEDKFYRKLIYANVFQTSDKILNLCTKGDANFSLINVKSPGTKNATTPVSPSFSSGVGWAPNGTTQYINSRFAPSVDGVNYTLNNAGVIFYTPTAEAGSATKVEFGASAAAGANAQLASLRTNTNVVSFRVNQTANTSISNSNSDGWFHFRRTTSAAVGAFRNGLSLGTASPTSVGLTSNEVYLGCFNSNGTPSGFSTKTLGFYMPGASFNGLEHNLYAYFKELISTKERINSVSFGDWKNLSTDLTSWLTSVVNLDNTFSDVPELNQEYLVGSAFSGSVNAWQGAGQDENDYIYGAPSTNTTILRINAVNDTYSEIATACTSGAAKYGGLAYDPVTKKIIFCPQNATAFMVYDTVTGEVYFFDTTGIVANDASGNLTGAVKWYGIYRGADGRFYCIPFNTDTVAIIDLSDNSIEFIDTSGIVTFGNGNLNDVAKWDGGTTFGSTLLGSPSNAVDFLKINTLLGTCQRVGSIAAGTTKHAISCVSKEGFGYIFPYFDNRIIKYNFSNDTYAYLAATIGSIDTNIKVAAAQMMADGRILLTPSTPTNSIMLDTGTDALTTVGVSLGTGNKFIGGDLSRAGAQYTIPYNSTRILKQTYLGKYITLPQNFILNRTGKYGILWEDKKYRTNQRFLYPNTELKKAA